MDAFSWTILLSSAAVGVVHVALGPDHYLPFIMLARARGWSLRRTLAVTLACGVGHVGSSVLLGLAGVALGWGAAHVEALEGLRGGVAAWALILFGFAYGIWGVRVAVRRRAGIVPHEHGGRVHLHANGAHAHEHTSPERARTLFWTLFLVFVLGPCEPMIPFFVAPASRGAWGLAFATGLVFSAVTIASMLVLTGVAAAGVKRLPLGAFERWSHAMAGGIIAASGLAVVFLGL